MTDAERAARIAELDAQIADELDLELSDALSDPSVTVSELPDGADVDAEFDAIF